MEICGLLSLSCHEIDRRLCWNVKTCLLTINPHFPIRGRKNGHFRISSLVKSWNRFTPWLKRKDLFAKIESHLPGEFDRIAVTINASLPFFPTSV